MTKEQILADVQDIFRDVFDEEDLVIKDETNADDIEDWDSLAQVRLTVAIENLQVARENFMAAESRIRDVDVASEAAELTRLNILQQAATAMVAQANQQPGLALQLLQG